MSEPITSLGEPKFGKYRETHIDYSESRTVEAVSIETFLTFDELVELVRELRGKGEDA